MNYLDALDGMRAHVSREELVAEHGQALLKRKLEPVPATNKNGQRRMDRFRPTEERTNCVPTTRVCSGCGWVDRKRFERALWNAAASFAVTTANLNCCLEVHHRNGFARCLQRRYYLLASVSTISAYQVTGVLGYKRRATRLTCT